MSPLVLGLPRAKRAPAVLALTATAAAFRGPFVVAAPTTFHLLGLLRIVPRPGSVLWLFGLRGHVEHWLRPIQFGADIAAASYVAMRGRWTATPLVGIAVRVALDPYAYGYYGLAPVLAALLWDLTRPTERRLPVWTMWALFVEVGLPLVAPASVCGVGQLVWVIAILGVFLADRRREPDTDTVSVSPTPALVSVYARYPQIRCNTTVFVTPRRDHDRGGQTCQNIARSMAAFATRKSEAGATATINVGTASVTSRRIVRSGASPTVLVPSRNVSARSTRDNCVRRTTDGG